MKGTQLQDPFWIANQISGYLNSTLSPSEQRELFAWVAENETNYEMFCAIVDEKQLMIDHTDLNNFDTESAWQKQRVVELIGEAYFQVKHDDTQPFLVKTARQVVEDIGTEFNINAYDDEKVVETTLAEGSIKVTNQAGDTEPIQPGEQTLVAANHKIMVKKADLQKVKVWKNGEFFFKGDDIPYILRQVSRWYNVDITYLGQIPVSKFAGQASRNITLEQMMDILRESGIEITLTNRTLFVKGPQ